MSETAPTSESIAVAPTTAETATTVDHDKKPKISLKGNVLSVLALLANESARTVLGGLAAMKDQHGK